MPVIWTGNTCFDAWLAGATYLAGLPGAEAKNVLLEIEEPTVFDSSWFTKIDPRKVAANGENPADVANTLFPQKTWTNSSSRDDFYLRYQRAHERGRTRRWGTYFLRLISFGTANVNQLERGIEVLNNWSNDPGTAIVFHLSSAELDRPRPIGAPCLQLIQLQAWGGRVDMTVVYRNHDYFNKALPNLVGLGRLLNFICTQSGRSAGSLTCLSGHAYSNSTKAQFTKLIERA